MKDNRAVKLVILFMIFSCLLTWVSTSDAHGKAARMEARKSMVMGRLEQVDSGYVVKSGKTSYVVIGQDFSSFVGKKVKVRGTVKRGEKGNVLEVTKIEEFKRRK